MMLRIGICDDSPEARQTLRWSLERLLEKKKAAAQFFEFSSGEGLLAWYQKNSDALDLLFLDIEMAEKSGMDAARALRQGDGSLQIVFVTGYADYVYDGYSVGALGYLLKPAKEPQLADVLARVLAAMERCASEVYICRSAERFYRIPRGKILYFTSDKRQIRCVTAEDSYTFYGRLDAVEQELSDARFVRIHQSFLVNADAVEKVDSGEVTLFGGRTLPVSRSCRTHAMAALTRALLS